MTAAERIKAALQEQGKTKGARGPRDSNGKESKPLVELVAADILECCGLAEPDATVAALWQGSSAGKPDRKVYVYADDAFHLVERCGG